MKTEKLTPEQEYLERIREIAARYEKAKHLHFVQYIRDLEKSDPNTARLKKLEGFMDKLTKLMDEQDIIYLKNGEHG